MWIQAHTSTLRYSQGHAHAHPSSLQPGSCTPLQPTARVTHSPRSSLQLVLAHIPIQVREGGWPWGRLGSLAAAGRPHLHARAEEGHQAAKALAGGCSVRRGRRGRAGGRHGGDGDVVPKGGRAVEGRLLHHLPAGRQAGRGRAGRAVEGLQQPGFREAVAHPPRSEEGLGVQGRAEGRGLLSLGSRAKLRFQGLGFRPQGRRLGTAACQVWGAGQRQCGVLP